MASIATNISESVYQIKRWRGVNEAAEGEAALAMGEAAAMRNFRVTGPGALQKRPGSANVAGLAGGGYTVADAGDETALFTEEGESSLSLTLYPGIQADSMGALSLTGTPAVCTAANAGDYEGWYYSDGAGGFYRFEGLARASEADVKEARVEGFKSWRNGLETLPAGWAARGMVACGGAEACVGAARFSLPAAAESITLRLTAGRLTQAGSIFADIRAAELERPVPATLGRGAVFAAPAEGETAEAVFTGEYPAGTYYAYLSSDSACAELRASGAAGLEIEYAAAADNAGRGLRGTAGQGGESFEWYFTRLRAAPNSADCAVRGLWSGYVGGEEVLCAACGGYLWQLERSDGGVWSKTACGTVDTSEDVFMFGFDEKLYLLNGSQYRVWDGESLTDVAGYRPLVAVSAPPEGGGTSLEQVNKLCGQRRMRFSPDGSATTFQLPEREVQSIDYVRYVASGVDLTSYETDLEDGTVTITPAPAEGVDSLEVGWTVGANSAAEVRAMRCAELYNGEQDTRVFLYGDGSSRCLYSGIDYDGLPRADYFPELNAAHIGDANTPVTALIRHYDRLLAFKTDSAWALGYAQLTLADGSVTAGFYVSPVNRSVGCCALGQAVLVENRPRTLDARSVIEWLGTASASYNGDERNAQRVSQRVDRTIRSFDLASAKTFYDKYAHEYYVIGPDGTALVYGVDCDAWYIYTNFAARCLINYKDELYFGTADGFLRHFSADYRSDAGEPIDARWESGSMDFGADFRRKYSAMLWVGIRPEDGGALTVTAETDRKKLFAEYAFASAGAAELPEMKRIKLKAKKFTYYKLVLENDSADTTATVVSVDIRVRGTGYVR